MNKILVGTNIFSFFYNKMIHKLHSLVSHVFEGQSDAQTLFIIIHCLFLYVIHFSGFLLLCIFFCLFVYLYVSAVQYAKQLQIENSKLKWKILKFQKKAAKSNFLTECKFHDLFIVQFTTSTRHGVFSVAEFTFLRSVGFGNLLLMSVTAFQLSASESLVNCCQENTAEASAATRSEFIYYFYGYCFYCNSKQKVRYKKQLKSNVSTATKAQHPVPNRNVYKLV